MQLLQMKMYDSKFCFRRLSKAYPSFKVYLFTYFLAWQIIRFMIFSSPCISFFSSPSSSCFSYFYFLCLCRVSLKLCISFVLFLNLHLLVSMYLYSTFGMMALCVKHYDKDCSHLKFPIFRCALISVSVSIFKFTLMKMDKMVHSEKNDN